MGIAMSSYGLETGYYPRWSNWQTTAGYATWKPWRDTVWKYLGDVPQKDKNPYVCPCFVSYVTTYYDDWWPYGHPGYSVFTAPLAANSYNEDTNMKKLLRYGDTSPTSYAWYYVSKSPIPAASEVEECPILMTCYFQGPSQNLWFTCHPSYGPRPMMRASVNALFTDNHVQQITLK